MKIDFELPGDERVHQYCLECRVEAIERVQVNGRTFYDCGACGRRRERSLVIDPGVRWWLGEDREYWHESAGVFLRRGDGRFLFFARTIYPFAMTVPSGHVDTGEEPAVAAGRELSEEAAMQVEVEALRLLGVHDIVGDSCRRGADAHRWHAYLACSDDSPEISDEGEDPSWLTLEEADAGELIVPVRFVLDRYRAVLAE